MNRHGILTSFGVPFNTGKSHIAHGSDHGGTVTLKQEATKPAAFNFLQQRERFDEFIEVYNHKRPHQALNGAYPGDIHTPSPRPYQPPPDA